MSGILRADEVSAMQDYVPNRLIASHEALRKSADFAWQVARSTARRNDTRLSASAHEAIGKSRELMTAWAIARRTFDSHIREMAMMPGEPTEEENVATRRLAAMLEIAEEELASYAEEVCDTIPVIRCPDPDDEVTGSGVRRIGFAEDTTVGRYPKKRNAR